MPNPSFEFIKMLITGKFPEEGILEIAADGEVIRKWPGQQSGDTVQSITLMDIPSYVTLMPAVDWNLKRATRYPGFLIRLSGLSNLEEYLKGQFGKGRQSSFKLYRKRLERSFDIRYVVYFGEITDSEYERLFEALMEMIRVRFREKETNNEDRENFPVYRQYLLEGIRSERANCQVIYDGDHPVYISFNVISGKSVIGLVNGFDTDYYKFHPGFTGILNLVEWSINRGYHFMDLLKGDLSYKRLFSNDIYYCQIMVIFPADSKYAALKASLKTGKFELVQRLLNTGKKLGLRDIFRQFKKWRYRLSQGGSVGEMTELVFNPISENKSRMAPEMVPLHNPQNSVRRALFTYLYHSGEHRSQISLFANYDGSEVYLEGPKGLARLTNFAEKRSGA